MLLNQEPIVFDSLMESLIKSIPAEKISQVLRRFEQVGVLFGQNRKLLPAYSRATWEHCLRIVAEAVYPDLTIEAAHEQVGLNLMNSYAETFIGRALKPMIRLLGPKRGLARSQMNFRSGNNYSVAKYIERGPSSVDLWMNEPGLARFYVKGTMTAAMNVTGAKNYRIEIPEVSGEGCLFRITWSSGDSAMAGMA